MPAVVWGTVGYARGTGLGMALYVYVLVVPDLRTRVLVERRRHLDLDEEDVPRIAASTVARTGLFSGSTPAFQTSFIA